MNVVYPPDVASTRIVGGEDAQDGDAPFQCSMQVNKQHFCGCSIISSKWILTAGHCVAGYETQSHPHLLVIPNTDCIFFFLVYLNSQSTNRLEILVGTNDLRNGGTYYKTEKIIQHEKYNQPQFANDVGLVRIKGTLELSDKVRAIKFSDEEVPDGANVQLTGWGRLSVCLLKLIFNKFK